MAAQVVARFCCTHSKFVYPDVKGKTWFPGHMAKGLREATEILKDCDLAIEVHDARISIHHILNDYRIYTMSVTLNY